MKRLLASTLAVLAITTACGVAEDTTAATVEGIDISTTEVAKVAKTTYIADRANQGGAALVSSSDTSVGSAKLRLALGFIVQVTAIEHQVTARKATITSEDRQSGESQVSESEQQSGTPLEPVIRKLIVRFFSAQSALVRVIGDGEVAEPTPADVEAYFDEHSDEFGVISCVDGFAVQQPNAEAAQAAIDRGDEITAILSDATIQAQPLSQDGSEACVNEGQVTEETLKGLVETGPVGEWVNGTIEDPQNGTLTVFIRANSREQATATTPAVVQQITALLTEQATTARNDELNERLQSALEDADVEIDPRYGSWDPSQGVVTAPAAPRLAGPPVTTPSLPVQ